MRPPVFELLMGSPTIAQETDGRIYAFGSAPQDVARPYVVWQILTGTPTSLLDGVPPDDQVSVQVDVYADTELSAESIFHAARDVMDTSGYVTSFGGAVRDDLTTRYRVRMDASLFVNR